MSTTTAASAAVTKVVTKVVTAAASATAASNATRASPQGGILEGGNPSVYSSSNPINTLIIQAGIIIIFCRLLHWPLSKLRQPRVIAEVIGGILLGPSVMGHIPGFTNAIFPAASLPTLNSAANIGLILFLFLVGLEADFRFLASNWRVALSVGALGMSLPFGLGVALAYGLYNQFKNEPGTVPISFGVFLLFVGVAMAITAFPVLCRILTELKLLRTPVGVIVLSAGVANDVVGWVLLALCVALVNASSGLTAVWIILVAIGYTLFLFFLVRPAFVWVLRKTGSLQNGPSQMMVALTVLMILASAFFTGAIGIHPMFGGFMIGLICPHQGGFAVKLTEKLEDLVTVLFLPLYFAYSGLSTNLGLLNNGITWAYVIGVIAVAFFAKVIGGTIAARLNGMVWRESFTIGTLMSCKGLVELIVLNIGLQAKILSNRTFTIFVVMALVTTFATTPLVSWLYPHSYQVKLEAWKRGELDWATGEPIEKADGYGDGITSKTEKAEVSKVIAYLRLDNLPGMLTLLSLLSKPASVVEKSHHLKRVQGYEDDVVPDLSKRPLQVHGVRLTALTERESSVMHVTEFDEFGDRDPVLNTVTAFGQLKNLSVSGRMLLTPESSFAQSLVERASDVAAELMLLPWSDSGAMSEIPPDVSMSTRERFANSTFSHFMADTVQSAPCAVAVFIDQGFGTRKKAQRHALSRTVSSLSARDVNAPDLPSLKQGHHIFLPYFGSENDRLALRLVLQLAQDPAVTATIVHFETTHVYGKQVTTVATEVGRSSSDNSTDAQGTSAVPTSAADARHYAAFFATMRDTLPVNLASRVVFESCSLPMVDPVGRASEELKKVPKNAGDLVVLGRNATAAAVGGGRIMEGDARSALGDVADEFVSKGIATSLLVVQAAPTI